MRKVSGAVLCGLLLLTTPLVQAACQDGTAACMRNGCPGVRECVGGRWLGCEISDQCLAQPPVRDRVTVNLVVPGEEVGVLFKGASSGAASNERSISFSAPSTGTTATHLMPNVTAPAGGASVVVFSRSRQPQWWPAPWTGNADTVQVPLSNNIRFNVTFWILTGNFATVQTNATAAVLAVNNAYRAERTGLRIGFVTVNDAAANPAAASLLAGGTLQQYESLIGVNRGEINVYVIDTVFGSPNMGVNFDGTPVILLAVNTLTFPQLLEHEIGHAFVLWHVGPPDFGPENVMAPVVFSHQLTEGQTFRMHFHPSSQINVFGLRGVRPTFVCDAPGAASPTCPAINRRLWVDGPMPAN